MAAREIYWHLPGFYSFRFLNQVTINLMKDYPYCFRDGYRVGSVYGTIPGAIWNGGRAAFGILPKSEVEKIIQTYNEKGVPVRFTWTNSLLEKEHVYDTYCNMVMRVADNGFNQVLVNRPVLEEYIREHYPSYPIISSTTKRILDPEQLQAELSKDYALVVLDYDFNHNGGVLSALEPQAERIEILVNEICNPGCPKRVEHYRTESQAQLDFDLRNPFVCPNNTRNRTFAECMSRPAFLSNEEIAQYAERGFVNYKIGGRGLPEKFVMDAYLYYLVKEEKKKFIQEKMQKILDDIARARQARK